MADAVIYLDVPEWQIGRPVTVFFPDTMMKKSVCELMKQEAVKPLAQVDDTFECSCGAIVGWDELDASGIVQERFNYCPFCGKPIDWEGR